MQVISTIAEFQKVRRELHGTLGVVLTMGYLHEGHLALVKQARAENDTVASSIFVNPTQFAAGEDFTTYPRDMDHDLHLLEAAGVDLLFTPTVAEMYPAGFQTYVEVTDVSQGLEGALRPGHFRGVATVVTKLFNIIQPTRAYFGQKDAQQVVVIQHMVTDLAQPVEVIVGETVRDTDGLALSSRNVYLTPEQRAVAPSLYRALQAARSSYDQGERDAAILREVVLTTLTSGLGNIPAKIDYVSIADALTLREMTGPTVIIDRPVLVSLAVKLGIPRLIDNIVLR